MTEQQVFDKVVAHLRTQNSRSVRMVKYWTREQEESAYRGADDKKCAGGCLIEDTEYDANLMEGYTFGSFLALDSTPKSLKDRLAKHAELIDALNFVHDFSPVSSWEDEFAALASSFKLKYTKASIEEVEEEK